MGSYKWSIAKPNLQNEIHEGNQGKTLLLHK